MKKKPRKAVWCDTCISFEIHEDEYGIPIGTPCGKGHKPRFYTPPENDWLARFGWKKRCLDFKELLP